MTNHLFLKKKFVLSNLLSNFIKTKSEILCQNLMLSLFKENALKFLLLAVTALLLASLEPLAVTLPSSSV